MKYLELVSAIFCWIIAVLWLKNSPPDEFYEPLIAVIGGVLLLFDSLRRFGLFTRVHISMRKPKINPWSFAGGKINKADVSCEIYVENNNSSEIAIENIEFIAPARIKRCIGDSNCRVRLVDLANIGTDVSLPIVVSANSTMVIFAESTHDATSFEKYDQASNLGKLETSEYFDVAIKYSCGTKEKIISTGFFAETADLVSKARLRYEEFNDHKGVVMIIEKT